MLLKLILPVSLYFLNVTTRKCKNAYAAYICGLFYIFISLEAKRLYQCNYVGVRPVYIFVGCHSSLVTSSKCIMWVQILLNVYFCLLHPTLVLNYHFPLLRIPFPLCLHGKFFLPFSNQLKHYFLSKIFFEFPHLTPVPQVKINTLSFGI